MKMGGKNPSNLKKLLDKCRCPACGSEKLVPAKGKVVCDECKMEYGTGENWIDFVGIRPVGPIAQAALETWGKRLHSKSPMEKKHELHFPQFGKVFGADFEFPQGRGCEVLEMGCGAGGDATALAQERPDLEIWGCDLGENIPDLAERMRSQPNLRFFRADCREMPVRDGSFERIVSFGVFHHTSDPAACVRELARILSRNGKAFVYLYKDHEDNCWKRAGVKVERVLMKILAGLPLCLGRLFCFLMTLPCLLLFSWPAQLFKRIPFTRRMGNSMPLHWGTTPASILGDLEDRLLAPVNHRFSRREFEKLFRSAGLADIRVVTTPFGHYALAKASL